jgi:arylsulfatase
VPALLVQVPPVPVAAGTPPSVVFVLLDTTRADRFGAVGNSDGLTPTLDALAADGVIFRRHFANAHATRSSLPQLMSGRYYHQNILYRYATDAHPRELSFSRRDPGAHLLPEILHLQGYRTLGVSAHPWVVAESEFGRHFDRLDLVPFTASEGHGDAVQVVSQALSMWALRDDGRPLFLYLHLMDMHMPRPLPTGAEMPAEARASGRFSPGGEPLFNREARRWARSDARDFTPADRRHFGALYDARVRHADARLGRLLAGLRAADPGLRRTLVVVVADHGEELGEDGRTDHTQSLADGVQHIPWIMAGAGVRSGQRVDRLTENIDVVPTILAALGLPAPVGNRMNGRAQLRPDGTVCASCAKTAAYYAWEEYRAVRTGSYLLRQEPPDSMQALCAGREHLYRVSPGRLEPLPLDGRYRGLAQRLRRRLARRLNRREQAFRARRYGTPTTPILLRPRFWQVESGDDVTCVPVDGSTPRREFDRAGWLWSGRGLTVLHDDGTRPLPVAVDVPDGAYEVDVAARQTTPEPWFFGFGRWRRRSFLPETPAAFVPLGTLRATAGRLSVAIPPGAGRRHHLLGLRLTPPGATAPKRAAPTPAEIEQEERLRALGYVQ